MRTGGRDEFGCVHTVFVTGRDPPARGFLGVVAPLTLPQPIVRAGRPAAVARFGVIAMPNRRITVRGATALIPQPDEPGQTRAENTATATPSPPTPRSSGAGTAAAAWPATAYR